MANDPVIPQVLTWHTDDLGGNVVCGAVITGGFLQITVDDRLIQEPVMTLSVRKSGDLLFTPVATLQFKPGQDTHTRDVLKAYAQRYYWTVSGATSDVDKAVGSPVNTFHPPISTQGSDLIGGLPARPITSTDTDGINTGDQSTNEGIIGLGGPPVAPQIVMAPDTSKKS